MRATLIEQISELLVMAEKTGVPISLLKRHIQLVGEKGVHASQLTDLHRSGLYSDILEVARRGMVSSVDRTDIRNALGLVSTEASSSFIITVTHYDTASLPRRHKEVKEDVVTPTGQLELEIIKLLKVGEDFVQAEEMRIRAREMDAHLGFLHAQALLDVCGPTNRFNLPAGPFLLFPGTVITDYRGDEFVPCLQRSCDGKYHLYWRSLSSRLSRRARLVRWRAL